MVILSKKISPDLPLRILQHLTYELMRANIAILGMGQLKGGGARFAILDVSHKKKVGRAFAQRNMVRMLTLHQWRLHTIINNCAIVVFFGIFMVLCISLYICIIFICEIEAKAKKKSHV